MDKPIAVIGMGAIFPDAVDISEYWSNILNRKDCIRDIPEDYWNLEDYYDPDPSARDKTYGYKAGLVPSIDFDSMEYGISPKAMESTAVEQLFALVVAKQALLDAGMLGENAKPFNRDKVGVILAAGLGKTAFSLSRRLEEPRIRKILKNSGVPEHIAARVIERLKDSELEWDEACNPGYLANVVAGRISNRFDFYGTNCTVDAACASSMAALKYAVQELQAGDCDVVLTGGVNLDCSPFSFVSFSKTPVFSKSNLSRPFDKDADGMMMGDGVGMLVLKRLSDAERDGDRIYAVIRSIGASGDGRANSIYAPRKEGQLKALERAYTDAQIDPKSVGLIEAHGTGTAKGDACEADALIAFFNSYEAPADSAALGSVKSQIGHARIAAGVAGMIKAIMALHHKIVPPTINVANPAPVLNGSPFYAIGKASPWIVNNKNPVRRAGVSSFGFGGTNFHVVLEEYGKDNKESYRLHSVPEEVLLSASSKDELIQLCLDLGRQLKENGRDTFRKLVSSNKPIPIHEHRIGFTARDADEARLMLESAAEMMGRSGEAHWIHPKTGLCYRARGIDPHTKVVALFPGQGSQYLGMLSELTQNYPEMREMLELVDNVLIDKGEAPVSSIVYPPYRYDEKEVEHVKAKLTETRHTQPALAAVCGGLYRILRHRGFEADYFLGHSFGELTSLWAAGAMDDRLYAELAVSRGSFMWNASPEGKDNGAMLAVNGDLAAVGKLISEFQEVYIANENSNSQTIVSGSSQQIDALCTKLKALNIENAKLNVSGAFHSPLMEHAQQAFSEIVMNSSFHPLSQTVFRNATAMPYNGDADEIREALARQITSPVLFRSAVERIYAEGGRVFVEIGPKKVLSSLAGDILSARDCYIVSLNPSAGADAELQLRQAAVQLKVLGLDLAGDRYQRILPAEATKKSASVQTVTPNLFYTPQKEKKISEALNTIDQEQEHQYDGGHSMSENKNSVIGGTDPVWAIQEIQSMNSSVFEQFMKSQGEQIEVVKDIFQLHAQSLQSPEQSGAADKASRYLDAAERFQANSMTAYTTYFNEQGRLLDRYFAGNEFVGFPAREAAAASGMKELTEAVNLASAAQAPVSAPTTPTSMSTTTATSTALATTAPAATPPEPAPAQASEPQHDYLSLLFSIISEKTGYPQEMLEADMSMEMDLGIDSIKRVEIFSALSARLPGGFKQEDAEKLAGLSTIQEIVDHLSAHSSGSVKKNSIGNDRSKPTGIREIKRFEVQKKELGRRPGQTGRKLNKGTVIITRDGSGLSEKLAEALQAMGMTSVLLPLDSAGEEAIEAFFQKAASQFDNLCGVIHVSPAGGTVDNIQHIFDKRDLAEVQAVFFMAKYFYQYHLEKAERPEESFFVNVTRLDGELGLGKEFTGHAVQGSLFALTKCLQREWSQVICKAIDIHPECDAERAVGYILEELQSEDEGVSEVGRGKSGERIIPVLKESYSTALSDRAPQREDVFLVPGGARGITAQCVLRMAEEFQCKFILLGRTALEEPRYEWAQGTADKQAIRERIVSGMKNAGEKLKPVELDKRVHTIANQLEIKDTLARIEQAGAQALYMDCDITDVQALKACLHKAETVFGKVTGFIHGAGIMADKKIQRKSRDDYERVFNTKVKGLEAVLQAVDPGRLKHLVLFSSIAAYFGNNGQTDYAMANEVLNKFAYVYKRLYPDTRVCSINWGPWDGGMIHGTLKTVMQNSGMTVIPVETGAAYLVDELRYEHNGGVCQIVVNETDCPALPKVDLESVQLAGLGRGGK